MVQGLGCGITMVRWFSYGAGLGVEGVGFTQTVFMDLVLKV